MGEQNCQFFFFFFCFSIKEILLYKREGNSSLKADPHGEGMKADLYGEGIQKWILMRNQNRGVALTV